MSGQQDSGKWKRLVVQSLIGGVIGAVPVGGYLAYHSRAQRLSAEEFADSVRAVSIEEIKELQADPGLSEFEKETLDRFVTYLEAHGAEANAFLARVLSEASRREGVDGEERSR